MREPLKTRLISAAGLVTLVGVVASTLYLFYGFADERDLPRAFLVAFIFLGSIGYGLVLSRMEYGEWSKGKPWWDRMRDDGYRPPIDCLMSMKDDPSNIP